MLIAAANYQPDRYQTHDGPNTQSVVRSVFASIYFVTVKRLEIQTTNYSIGHSCHNTQSSISYKQSK